MTPKRVAYESFIIVVASLMISVALHTFVNPNDFVSGGIGGIATLLQQLGIVSAWLSLLIMNIPLTVLALIYLKGRFTVRTLICSYLITGIMALLDFTNFVVFTGDRLMASAVSGVMYGIAIHLMMSINASSGGTEIIARLVILKKPSIKISRVLFLTDCVVILASGIAFSLWSVVYAMISSYACIFLIDLLAEGIDRPVVFYCFTEKPDTLFEGVFKKYASNARQIEARGMKGESSKAMLTFVVKLRQVHKFRQELAQIDPEVFAYGVTVKNMLKDDFDPNN